MATRVKLKDNEVRIALKSRIKLAPEQKLKNDDIFFKVNQLYNFLIEKLVHNKEFQTELVAMNYAIFKDFEYKNKDKSIYKINKFVITNKSAIRNYISPLFLKYMDDRKLPTKGLSKQFQLKLEDFLDTFNKINLSPIKSHNFKLTSLHNKGSFTTDSSLKYYTKIVSYNIKQNLFSLDKTKFVKSKRTKKVQHFIKVGTEHYELLNNKLDFSKFEIKNATLSRDNGQYFISLSGIRILKKDKLNPIVKKDNEKLLSNSVAADINFENVTLSNGEVENFQNMQLKLNLHTKKFEELQREKSEREIINKEVLKTICKTDNIEMYIPKFADSKRKYKLSKKAKEIYNSILSNDKKYRELNKQINKLYKKRTNIQNDVYQKLANKISNEFDLLLLEDLNVNNMVNGDINNSNLYNASLGKLLTILSNKMLTTGKVSHKIESYYTSQDCSSEDCDYRNSNLKKEDRSWLCPKCFTLHNRDYNASKNMEIKGIKSFQALVSEPKLTVKKKTA